MNLKILLIFASVLHVSSSAYQFQPVQDGCSYWKFLSEDIKSDVTKRLHCILDQNNQAGIVYTTWELIPAGKCPYFDRYEGKLRTFSCDRGYRGCPNDSYPSSEARRMEGCLNGQAISQAYKELQQRNTISPAPCKQNEGEATKIIIAVISTLVIELLVICICKFCVCSSKGRIWRNCGKKEYKYTAVKTRDVESGPHPKRFKGKGEYESVKTTDDESEEEQPGPRNKNGGTSSQNNSSHTDISRVEIESHMSLIPCAQQVSEVRPTASEEQPNNQDETWRMAFIPPLSKKKGNEVLKNMETFRGCTNSQTHSSHTDVSRVEIESRMSLIPCAQQVSEFLPIASEVQPNNQDETLRLAFIPSLSKKDCNEFSKYMDKFRAVQSKIPESDGYSEGHQAKPMDSKAAQTKIPENDEYSEGYQAKPMDSKATQTNIPENQGHQAKQTENQDSEVDKYINLIRRLLELFIILTTKGLLLTDVHPKMKDAASELDISQYATKTNIRDIGGPSRGHQPDYIKFKDDILKKRGHSRGYQPHRMKSKATKTNIRDIGGPSRCHQPDYIKFKDDILKKRGHSRGYQPHRMKSKGGLNRGHQPDCMNNKDDILKNGGHSRGYQLHHMKSKDTKMNFIYNELHHEDNLVKQSNIQVTKRNILNIELNNEDYQAKKINFNATKRNIPTDRSYDDDYQAKNINIQDTKTNSLNNEKNPEASQWNIPLIETHREVHQVEHMDNQDDVIGDINTLKKKN